MSLPDLLLHVSGQPYIPLQRDSTHPSILNVLFIEYAKCFPSDVNKSGR